MSTEVIVRPRRIRRERTSGWSVGDALIVDRTSRWGNPFRVQDAIEAEFSNPRRACVTNYRAWLEGSPEYPDTFVVGKRKLVLDRRLVQRVLPQMRNVDLACPCPLPAEGEPDWCHAAVLLEIANKPRISTPDVINPGGGRTITGKRHCNGCGTCLGDVSEWEISCAVAGRGLPDVRRECPVCLAGGEA